MMSRASGTTDAPQKTTSTNMSRATMAPFTDAWASRSKQKYERTRSRTPSEPSTDAIPISPDSISSSRPGPSTPR